MINSMERKNNLKSPENIITLIPIVISSFIAILLIIFYVIPQYINSNKVNLELNALIKKKNGLDDLKNQYKIINQKFDKLNKESKELKEIAKFNSDLKNAIININSRSALFQELALIIPKDVQLLEFISRGNSLKLKAKLSNDDYLEILNSFLISLDKSELIKFNDIDLVSIKATKNDSKNLDYIVEITTKLSTKYSDINQKYLIKLGSYGLFNRLNIIKNLDKRFD